MRITKNGIAGTLESSDCMVAVFPHESRVIYLESAAKKRFEQHLNTLINQTLDELGVESGRIEIKDRGALDYCLRARIISAVERSVNECLEAAVCLSPHVARE